MEKKLEDLESNKINVLITDMEPLKGLVDKADNLDDLANKFEEL